MARALEPGYFDRLYADKADPWDFEASAYERDKYAATLRALPRPHYDNAVEVGCSIGVLTRSLAAHTSALLGLDVAEAALAQARARCVDLAHLRFARSTLPHTPPEGRFDLVVLSEILYYFDRDGLHLMVEAVGAMAAPETDLLLVHWLGPTPDYPMTGDEAADHFLAGFPRRVMLFQSRTPQYRIDVLRIAPASG